MSVCNTFDGQCYMENSCDYVRRNVKGPFGMKITLTDEHDQEFILELTEEQMLRDVTGLAMVDKACFLPFYNSAKTSPNTWVVGSIVLDSFYTVYDLTSETGDLAVGIQQKSPNFVPDTDDGGGGGGGITPEDIKRHGALIATIIVFLIIGAMICCFLYKKKKQAKESNVVFETYKQY